MAVFGVGFAFPERSAPQFCLPLTRSRRAVSGAETLESRFPTAFSLSMTINDKPPQHA